MTVYSKMYLHVIKKNFMLLIVTIALLFFTFAFWMGIPVYVISDFLSKFNTPHHIQNVCVLFGICILFSIFFIPINFKVAKALSEIKTLQLFSRIHLGFILLTTIIFYLIFILAV